jgi:sulfatase modifying factor 1
VTGGTYYRTYENDGGGPTGEADPATVSSFKFDRYLVTVGRFRQYVSAWNGGYMPPAGSGKHTHLNSGQGLENGQSPGTYEQGWLASDDANVAPTDGNLVCTSVSTWTASAGTGEQLPMTCVNWYEAYAFCIWDGGFLPSEAEWEYAAAGGSQQREYPWGSTDPGKGNQYAIYGCYYPNGSGMCAQAGASSIALVGTSTLGAGAWGQLDLAGEVEEWTLDMYAGSYVDPCADCSDLTAASDRVLRGGLFSLDSSLLSPPVRDWDTPFGRGGDRGLRCARVP